MSEQLASLAPQRRRLSPEEREKMLLDEATLFFAEKGFEANIRDLAIQCGVSQALIYKYFSSKEQLVERVYQTTFLKRWRPEWNTILADRSKPIRERLLEFYKSYVDAIDDFVWIRIVLHSGLSHNGLTGRYIREHLEPLITKVAAELFHSSTRRPGKPSQTEIEHVWALHSTFIYYLIRKDVFGTATLEDRHAFIEATVDRFLAGV